MVSLYIQDIVQKGEPRDHTRLSNIAVRCLEQRIREKHVSSRDRQLEKPASGASAATGKNEAQGKRNSGYCVKWTTRSQRSPGDRCGIKCDPEKKRTSKGKVEGPRPSRSPRRNSLERGTPTGKVLKEKEASSHASPLQRAIVQMGMPVITECSSHPKRTCKLRASVRFKHTEEGESEQKKRNNSVVVAKTLD